MAGKKLIDALKTFDRDQFYSPTEALDIVKNVAKAGFDESVDVVGPPRRRPAQGRSDGPRHRRPARRHGQGRPRGGVRHR